MEGGDFAEFVISLRPAGGERFALTWQARSPTSKNRVGGALELAIAEAAFLVLEHDPSAYGEALRDALFADAGLLKGFHEVRAQAAELGVPLRLRVSLDAADAFLNTLRWETLGDPDSATYRPLALDETVLLSRYPTSPQAIAPAAESRRKLSALVVIANPLDHGAYGLAAIDATGEEQRIIGALGPQVRTRVLRRDQGRAGPPTFERVLAALREEAPSILYILCHGSTTGDDYGLWLEDGMGRAARVAGADFAAAVAGMQRRPLVTVLAACDSGTQTRDALVALGPALAVAGIGAVIAMQGKIAIATAATMMPRLFAELGRHGEVDRAVVAARSEVRATPDWWMPALLLRIEDGLIWRRERPQAGLSRLQQALAAAGAALALVLLGALLWLQLAPRLAGPAPMTGGFRVAVAQFGRLNEEGVARRAPEGEDLARVVYDQISADIAQLAKSTALDLRVNPPELTGWVGDEAAALRLADDLRADLLIFGALGADGRSFTPRFVLTERLLGEAPELTGPFSFNAELRSRADAADNPVALKDLVNGLDAQAASLTHFIVGLAYYAVDEREEARAQFEAADAGWQHSAGREVILLFLGNAAGHQMDLAAADRYYAEALALNPEFARAHIGQAEILFQQSRGSGAATCQPDGIRQQGLEEARAQFDRALVARDQTVASDIPAKAALGKARVSLCLALATGGSDHIADARAAYQEVIDAFKAGNGRLQSRAAQAHAGLGQLLLSFQHSDNERDDYQDALSEYTRATDLAVTEEVRATYLGWQAYIFIQLGQCAEADKALLAADEAYARFRSFQQTYAPFEAWRAELGRQRETCSSA